MNFEVINEKNNVVFNTPQKECIPSKQAINTMLKIGYKFKIDGKALTKKQINELLK